MDIRHLTPEFAVGREPSIGDFAAIARRGFKTVINLRTEDETAGELDPKTARTLAHKAGLAYFHVPANKFEVFTDPVVEGLALILEDGHGPVLAYCTSGQRAAIVWAAASARREPVDGVLAKLTAAGFDFGFLRDDLEAQADRAKWMPTRDEHAPGSRDTQVTAIQAA